MSERLRDAMTQALGTSRSRRQVLDSAGKGAVGGVGAALLSGGLGPPLHADRQEAAAVMDEAVMASPASPVPRPPVVRRNVHGLDPDGPELRAFATAVAKMKALPDEDPRSWRYQAFIHMFPPADFGITTLAELAAFLAEPGHGGWFTCEHSTRFFWPWHRMQLYWFERIVRDLGECPDFALPYWDYFDPAQRTLPASFRSPADASNPLWEPLRDPSLNGGTTPTLTPEVENAIFNQCAGFAISDFDLASASLETTPHNGVHGWIGGDFAQPPVLGLMSSPLTSAQDPIFWLHHANLDRLWESWLALGNANPPATDLAWRDNDINNVAGLSIPYAFFDESGNQVTTVRVVRDVLSTPALGYAYEELFDPVAAMCPVPGGGTTGTATPTATPVATPAATPAAGPITPQALGESDPAETIAVGAEPVAVPVTLPRPEIGPEAVSRGETMVLTLEGVHGGGVQGAIFEVYVNLPEGEAPDYRSPYFVGYISLFGLQPWDDGILHGGHWAEQQFDISRNVAALEARGEWTRDLIVTIVPHYGPASRTPTAVGATPAALPTGPWITIERISVEVR